MASVLLTILALFAIVFVVFVAIVLKTSLCKGDAAVAKMDDAERAFLAQLETITAASTFKQIVDLLGQPDRPGAGIRPSWRAPGGSSRSQVAVYLSDGKPFKVKWMKIGAFTWERNFPENLIGPAQ